MKHDYADLRALTDRPPRWYDQYGVPRYDEPNPARCPDIYADEVAFFTIACQGCTRHFLVQTSWRHDAVIEDILRVSRFLDLGIASLDMARLSAAIDRTGFVSAVSQLDGDTHYPYVFHYGDPPVHEDGDGICPGSTMTSEFVRLDRLYAKNAIGAWVQRYPYPE